MAKVINKVTDPKLRALISKEIKASTDSRIDYANKLRRNALRMLSQAGIIEAESFARRKCDANNAHEFAGDDSGLDLFCEKCIHCGWVHRV